MSVDVRPVRGFADLRAFVALPFRLHAGTKWIPPLKLERYLFLNKRMNAYFKHGEAEYFLARRDGRVVGRITAQIDLRIQRELKAALPEGRTPAGQAGAIACRP